MLKYEKSKTVFASVFTWYCIVNIHFINNKAYCLKEWNAIAASLAVITAIIAAYLSLPSIWKQIDESEPNLLAYFDLDSRSNVIQFVIKNIGGGHAYDVKLIWEKALTDIDGNLIELPFVPIIPKNDCIRIFIDTSTKIFEQAKQDDRQLIFKGILQFKFNNNSKHYIKKAFEISLEEKRRKTRPITDEQNFYLKNSDISKQLTKIIEVIENKKE